MGSIASFHFTAVCSSGSLTTEHCEVRAIEMEIKQLNRYLLSLAVHVLHFYKDLGRKLSPEVRLGGKEGFVYGVDVREARPISLEIQWCRFWGGKKLSPQVVAVGGWVVKELCPFLEVVGLRRQATACLEFKRSGV